MARTIKIPATFADAEEVQHEAAVAQVGFDDFGEKITLRDCAFC